MYYLAADKRGALGGQECDAIGDVFDRTKSGNRCRALGILTYLVKMTERSNGRGIDYPGRYGIDGDSVPAALHRERP